MIAKKITSATPENDPVPDEYTRRGDLKKRGERGDLGPIGPPCGIRTGPINDGVTRLPNELPERRFFPKEEDPARLEEDDDTLWPPLLLEDERPDEERRPPPLRPAPALPILFLLIHRTGDHL